MKMAGFWRDFGRAAIGTAIGLFLGWLVLRQTNLREIQTILLNVERKWLFSAIAVYAISFLVRIVRWRILLSGVKRLSLGSVGAALLIGFAANYLLPARLGELFRADFAGRRYQLSRSAVVASIFVERVFDGLIVVLCLVLGRLFMSHHPLLSFLTTVSALLFLGLFGVLWLLSYGIGLTWLPRLPSVVQSRLNHFRSGLSGLQNRAFGQVAGLSVVVWVFEGLTLWSTLRAVGVNLGFKQMLTVVGLVDLSALIPSPPGFLGTYQYAFALTMGLFGHSSASGIAAATADQIFVLGSTSLLGILLYWYLSVIKKTTLINPSGVVEPAAAHRSQTHL
jgi:glycosyltransferase 2 family protein